MVYTIFNKYSCERVVKMFYVRSMKIVDKIMVGVAFATLAAAVALLFVR